MSDFERYAAQRLLDQATAAGVDHGLTVGSLCQDAASWAAAEWARQHPDEDLYCCNGAVVKDAAACLCWVPEYEVEQADPRPPTGPDDLAARPVMCGDCAFRPGSPERTDEWTAEALYASAAEGKPFWCHDGMRRPVRWRHPDGMVVEGSPDDWRPPVLAGIPYRADGSPGMLCAGWAAVAAGRAAQAASAPST